MKQRITLNLFTVLAALAVGAAAQARPTEAPACPLQLAQATPPASSASAPAAEAQSDNRETPARPAPRRRSVGVVIAMQAA